TSFTTGMDIDEIDGSDHEAVKDYEKTAACIQELFYYGKPVICAINGKAMGDGVAYALCSDYRIAVKNCFFMMPEINLGVFPGTGIIVLMTRVIGIPWTKKILMFAEKISAEKALEIGLIDQIVENQEELMKMALDRAKFLFTKNQTVLNAIKLCSNHLADKSYGEAYELEKIGSAWYEFEDKIKYIEDFRKKFY
ncbi:MAG: enoyl-CoA hydratase/isomerase family protein, partial [Candidatus Heimdallarchaeota archaeon]